MYVVIVRTVYAVIVRTVYVVIVRTVYVVIVRTVYVVIVRTPGLNIKHAIISFIMCVCMPYDCRNKLRLFP